MINIKDIIEQNDKFVNEAQFNASPSVNQKKVIMSILSHNKLAMVNESFVPSSAGNVMGAGAISMPDAPGALTDFADQTAGSADTPTLLGMSMSMMATTIALDLVAIAPATNDLVQLEYTDVVYTGGIGAGVPTAGGSGVGGAPTSVFTIVNPVLGALDLQRGATIDLHTNQATPTAAVRLTFLAKDRTHADKLLVMLESEGTFDNDVAGAADRFVATAATGNLQAILAAATHYALDDDGTATTLGGAGTVGSELTSAVSNDRGDMLTLNADGTPMNRVQSDTGVATSVEFRTYKKQVEVKSYQAIGNISRSQLRQFRQRGLDAIPMIRKTLQALNSQAINDLLLGRIRALGVTNAHNLRRAKNLDMNLFYDNIATTTTTLGAMTGIPAFIDGSGVDRTGTFTGIRNNETGGNETKATRRQDLLNRITQVGGLIGTISRHGSGDAAVLGPQLFGVVKTSAAFTHFKNEGSLTQDVNALYFAGDLNGIKIYCNPKQDWADNTITVLRTNKALDGLDYENLKEGIVFCPQDLADSVQIVPELTKGAQIMLESFFAIAEVGMQPEQAYFTFAAYIAPTLGGGRWA